MSFFSKIFKPFKKIFSFFIPKAPKISLSAPTAPPDPKKASALQQRSEVLSSARKRAVAASLSRGRSDLRIDLSAPSTGTGIAAIGRTSLTA